MKRSIRVDLWILLAAVPTLVLVTLVLGFVVYSALYSQILEGFDRKLIAACSVTSSFIDGDDHASLREPILMRALGWDAASDRLVGADAEGRVYAIDVETGEADPLGEVAVGRFESWAISAKRLFLLTDEGRTLIERAWPPQAGEMPMVRLRLPRASALAAITWDGDRLIGVGSDLREIPFDAHGQTVIGTLPLGAPVRSVGWAEGRLLLLRSDEKVSTIVPISASGASAGIRTPVRVEEDASRLADALATDGTRVWVATREGLVQWEQVPDGEAGQAADFASGFRSRNDPLYVRYVEPMRALMKKQDLTYIYSQIPLGNDRIAYVLDASEGDEQSVIGGQDVVPPEDSLATQQVMTTGQVYVGRVREFERWGLLKVSTGPIQDSAGRISATAGVDVNISTIREQTRTALMQVLALGSIGLLLASVASFALARRLTRPLFDIKAGALKVAAGRHGLAVEVASPTELRELAAAFNTLSRQTRDTLSTLERQRREFEHERFSRTLASRLRGSQAPPVVEESYLSSPGNELVNESGHCHAQGRTFVWLTDEASPDANASRAVAVRRDLASRMLSATPGKAPGVTLDSLLALIPTPRGALVEHATGEVVWRARDGTPAPSADQQGAVAFSSGGPEAGYRLLLRVKA